MDHRTFVAFSILDPVAADLSSWRGNQAGSRVYVRIHNMLSHSPMAPPLHARIPPLYFLLGCGSLCEKQRCKESRELTFGPDSFRISLYNSRAYGRRCGVDAYFSQPAGCSLSLNLSLCCGALSHCERIFGNRNKYIRRSNCGDTIKLPQKCPAARTQIFWEQNMLIVVC